MNTVAVLGEALIDVFPDRDVLGGAPFNVARNLAALGGETILITRVGSDARGDAVAAACRHLGMDTRGLQRDPVRATGTVAVRMQGTQHRFEIAEDQAWDHLDDHALVDLVLSARPGVIYFGTLAQRHAASRSAIRAGLTATTAPAFLDLNLRESPDNRAIASESLAFAQIVKVNDDELGDLLRWFVSPSAFGADWGTPAQRSAVASLMERFALQRLVVTRGEAGWCCFDSGQREPLQGTAPKVVLRDTVGAGDAFSSVLLLGEVRRWPLATTLQRAAAFASSVCTIQGAFDADSGIYRAAVDSWQN